VCKALQNASKTRSVWLNLCRPHLSPTETAPQTLHLERPIKLHTSHDLEFLFLRLKSADIGWRTDDSPPARKREIETTNPAKCIHLVEGGRWLLVASETGCITYLDLDASTPTESILIPDQFEPPIRVLYLPEIKVKMSIDMDNDSAFLSFNLLLSISIDDTPPDPKAHGVQIWKVSLALNDQQQGVGLKAEQLASFPLEPTVNAIFCQSILGDHLALTLLSDQHEESTLTFVIEWKQADGDRTNYVRRLLNPRYGKATVCFPF
jgi:hypothetical protein